MQLPCLGEGTGKSRVYGKHSSLKFVLSRFLVSPYSAFSSTRLSLLRPPTGLPTDPGGGDCDVVRWGTLISSPRSAHIFFRRDIGRVSKSLLESVQALCQLASVDLRACLRSGPSHLGMVTSVKVGPPNLCVVASIAFP